jgi:hypothetical protein
MDFIEKNQENNAIVWQFRCIVGHQGPLLRHDKDYNGSRFNVLVEWENGEITTEPLSVIAADDPVTCAVYAREHDLLDIEGWKCFRSLVKCEKHYLCLVKQAKMKSYHQSLKYKFGYRIPKDYEEALKLDELNQNTKWEDATITVMSQLKEYECFIDAGIYGRDKSPDGHKKICAHLVFDVKYDGHHKACYVAGGHLTDIPNMSVYSRVVSLRGLRMVAFLSELNGNAISFHRVCEAIASGYVVLTHLPGKFNPVDILSKHWGYQTIWPILKPILFFHGDTADLIQDDDTA